MRPARRQDFCLVLGHQRNRHRWDLRHRIRVSLQGKHVTRKQFSHKKDVHLIFFKKNSVHGCHGLLCLQRGAEWGKGNVRLSIKVWNYLGKWSRALPVYRITCGTALCNCEHVADIKVFKKSGKRRNVEKKRHFPQEGCHQIAPKLEASKVIFRTLLVIILLQTQVM